MIKLLLAAALTSLLPQYHAGQAAEPKAIPSTSSSAAEAYVAHFVTVERLKGEIELLQASAQSPGDAGDALLARLDSLGGDFKPAAGSMLRSSAPPVRRDLAQLRDRVAGRADRLRESWEGVRRGLLLREKKLAEVEKLPAGSSTAALWLNADRPEFWLSALLAVAVLGAVVLFHGRRSVRGYLAGGVLKRFGWWPAIGGWLVLVSIAAVLVSQGGARFASAEWPRDRFTVVDGAADARDRARLTKTRNELLAAHAARVGSRRRALASSLGRPDLADDYAEWERVRLELAAEQAVLRALPEAIQRDLETLAQLDDRLVRHAAEIERSMQLKHLLRGLSGLIVLGLVGSGGWLLRKVRRDTEEETAATCPLCLSVDQLVPTSPIVPPTQPGQPPPEPMPAVECQNVLSHRPRRVCRFTFPEADRPLRKLSLPTLGVPHAGKTHWLAMLYWELLQRRYPARTGLEPVLSDAADSLRRTVEEILHARLGPAATQRDRVPLPLVLRLTDRDPLGRSQALVHLFDYSGEVTTDMDIGDRRRERALAADGLFFFVDPTSPASVQADAWQRLAGDWRHRSGGRWMRPRAPLAMCVSKIDLLAGRTYGEHRGVDVARALYRDLEQIDPSGERRTLAVLDARSRRTAELLQTIWPDWDIVGETRAVFGRQVRFFPLTPVGLDDRGQADLNLRSIAPFGLLEPLLWLLHGEGYCVLS